MIRKGMSTLAAIGGILGMGAVGVVGFNMMTGDCGSSCSLGGDTASVTTVAGNSDTDKGGCCPLGSEAAVETVAMAGETCSDKASDCGTSCDTAAVTTVAATTEGTCDTAKTCGDKSECGDKSDAGVMTVADKAGEGTCDSAKTCGDKSECGDKADTVAIQTVSADAEECEGNCTEKQCDKGDECCKADEVASTGTQPTKG